MVLDSGAVTDTATIMAEGRLVAGSPYLAMQFCHGGSLAGHCGRLTWNNCCRVLMDLLAAEITAITGKDPGEHYQELENRFGSPLYERMDAPANREQKKVLSNLSPAMVTAQTLAGEPIVARLTHAPENNAPIGGLKIVTANGWFAARPSGTEDVYKIYAESFLGAEHLKQIQQEAQAIVSDAFRSAGV